MAVRIMSYLMLDEGAIVEVTDESNETRNVTVALIRL